MREFRSYGSVGGALGNQCLYLDPLKNEHSPIMIDKILAFLIFKIREKYKMFTYLKHLLSVLQFLTWLSVSLQKRRCRYL